MSLNNIIGVKMIVFFLFLGKYLDKTELSYLLNKCLDSEN